MAGQLKIGGNVIATHAGSEGAGTVTLDSSTLTIGSNTTIQGAMNAGSITSGVIFPDGTILQIVYGVCKDRKTVGTTEEFIIDIEFQTKGANSTFFAVGNIGIGGYADTHGFYMGLTLSAGSTPSTTDWMDRASSGDSNNQYAVNNGLVWGRDHGIAGGSDVTGGQYQVDPHTIVARKETTHALGATLSAGCWVEGSSTAYINRSQNRTSHETTISTLMVYEMAGGSNIVDVTDGDSV